MPDPLTIVMALGVSSVTAAVVLLLLGRLWRGPRPTGARLGWVLGVGAGLFVGCWLLEVRPRWPPREDAARFLTILLPAVVAVECLAAIERVPRGLAWGVRLLLAASAGRILLHQSRYLTDFASPAGGDWSASQTLLVLGGLAAALLLLWACLGWLSYRQPGPATPFALALACGGAGVADILAGNLTDGQIGLVLAAVLAGAAAASFALSAPHGGLSAIGVGAVGLFGLVLMGRFFSELSTLSAILLFLAPLFCGLPDLPRMRRLRPAPAAVLRIVVVALPLAIALPMARQERPKPPPPPPPAPQPTLEDYRNFVPPK